MKPKELNEIAHCSENWWENQVLLFRKEDLIDLLMLGFYLQCLFIFYKRMDDRDAAGTFSFEEPFPFPQEMFELCWDELVNVNQFHPLERIPSSENVDKSLFESSAIKENHPNTEVIPMEIHVCGDGNIDIPAPKVSCS
ncbi:UNVERIFIED_CONTAM: hypothetical protein NCL1_31032 [Trichonephila clavipes]